MHKHNLKPRHYGKEKSCKKPAKTTRQKPQTGEAGRLNFYNRDGTITPVHHFNPRRA